MKIFISILFLIFLFLCPFIVWSQQVDFYPGQLWLDDHGKPINAHGGGVMFYKGVYYWYGEHKVSGEAGNSAQIGVHVYSSKNLYEWKDEGIALAVAADDAKNPLARGCIIERPKVIYNPKTAKFVMWFHLELRGQGYDQALAATAISDSAKGPFHYEGAFRPNAGSWPLNVLPLHKGPISKKLKAAIAVEKDVCLVILIA